MVVERKNQKNIYSYFRMYVEISKLLQENDKSKDSLKKIRNEIKEIETMKSRLTYEDYYKKVLKIKTKLEVIKMKHLDNFYDKKAFNFV